MSYDTGGYRKRWTVPCVDLMSQRKRVVVALSRDRQSLLLITPTDAVQVSVEQARELAKDIHEATQHIPPMSPERMEE